MADAIVKSPQMPMTVRVQAMEQTLQEETRIRQLVKAYVNDNMVKDVDFGIIPGTPKPSLYKPGAEKLTSLFRCTPKFALIKDEEDFERGFFNYKFRIRLVSIDTKEVLAEGYGSANSREGRYRWRNSARKCPSCGKETIIKGKAEYGGGWVCWAKDGSACKAKFTDNDPAIVLQPQGKIENDDVATMANTILKMAKKRALVDGAIALAHCSDMFTQDVEDFAEDIRHEPPPPPPTKAPPKQTATEAMKAKLRARAVVDVPAGMSEAEAEQRAAEPPQPTPYEVCREYAKERGITDGKRLAAIIKGATGGTWREVTTDHVDGIRTAISIATTPIEADQAASPV